VVATADSNSPMSSATRMRMMSSRFRFGRLSNLECRQIARLATNPWAARSGIVAQDGWGGPAGIPAGLVRRFDMLSRQPKAQERDVPTIAYFLGIAVAMYYRDHNPPHIHVNYAGYDALIAIENARVLRGKLPPTVMLIHQAMGHLPARGIARQLGAGAAPRRTGTNCRTRRRC
jgi:hypothetical protein